MKILDVEHGAGTVGSISTPVVARAPLDDKEQLRESLIPKKPRAEEEARNINVTSAYLHVLGDLLMSVGVITAAIIINFKPEWTLADPLCTYLFSVIICCTSIPVFKDCMKVIMEGTPDDINLEQLEIDLSNVAGVEEVHDLHVWSISSGKLSLSCHIVSQQPLKSLNAATDLCRRQYKIYHTTIQVEGMNDNPHTFKCENDLH